jgi:phosphoribosyl 1,2-cyclic phosphodiesterase
MVDCGFSVRETERRLAKLGVQPADVDAIVVTHEHSDHVAGTFKFARRHRVPVWLSVGTWRAVESESRDVALNFCRDGQPFSVGDLQFSPFTVPHDAREPLQFHATDGQHKLGMLTDVGQSTPYLIQALSGCDALMIECNHDLTMLANSSYPAALKRRITSMLGHLSNEDTADLLAQIDQSRLKRLVAAHLSQKNNTAQLALAALRRAIRCAQTELMVACQDEGCSWIVLEG